MRIIRSIIINHRILIGETIGTSRGFASSTQSVPLTNKSSSSPLPSPSHSIHLSSSPSPHPSSSSSSSSSSLTFTSQSLPSLRYRQQMEIEGEKWNDRTTDTNDVKELFSRVRPNSPIPNDIINRAQFLCAQYLGGSWKNASRDRFTMKQITGGMSNLLFLVELCPSLELIHSEPRRALLRIHCQADIDQLLSESVVFTLLSERSLGPRLLGVFPGGRFEQFIPSRPLQCLEISDFKFIDKISPMLARVHSLDVPVGKEPQMINQARAWLDNWSKYDGSSKGIDMKVTKADVHSSKFPSHITLEDLHSELDFVEKFFESIKSPIVFSHNDMQEGNILLIDRDSSEDKDDELALIDFEYCNYNYRGFDLGNHMCEYGLDYATDEAPYYKIYPDKLRVKEERRAFCEGYMNELYYLHSNGFRLPSDIITGDKTADLNKLELEASLFMPISHLFWTCWSFVNAEQSSIAFGYAEYGRDRLAMYFDRKDELIEYMSTH